MQSSAARLRLGGHDTDRSVISFDDDASSLLRGFPADAFFGTNVLLGNADYRLPLAYVQRGVGTWPLFLRAFHVSAFVDVGQAWTARFSGSATKLSWGAEAGADVTAGYALPLTWVVGVGWGRDRSGTFPDNREGTCGSGGGFDPRPARTGTDERAGSDSGGECASYAPALRLSSSFLASPAYR